MTSFDTPMSCMDTLTTSRTAGGCPWVPPPPVNLAAAVARTKATSTRPASCVHLHGRQQVLGALGPVGGNEVVLQVADLEGGDRCFERVDRAELVRAPYRHAVEDVVVSLHRLHRSSNLRHVAAEEVAAQLSVNRGVRWAEGRTDMDGRERQRLRWTATRPSQSGQDQELTSGQRRPLHDVEAGLSRDVKTPV